METQSTEIPTEYYENRYTGELMTVRFTGVELNMNHWVRISEERYNELKRLELEYK